MTMTETQDRLREVLRETLKIAVDKIKLHEPDTGYGAAWLLNQIEEAIHQSGLRLCSEGEVCVPREPTARMIVAGVNEALRIQADDHDKLTSMAAGESYKEVMVGAYKAMIQAAEAGEVE